jgi:hypothetical protein
VTVPDPEGPFVEVPTFAECVIGYRAWLIGSDGQLWPLSDHRRAWQPGINTARCNCGTMTSLKFEWSWRDCRRVVEPAPAHEAPDDACSCGLYSWRDPPRSRGNDPRFARAEAIAGAVASWGRTQVHEDGFRAEHACVVALGYPNSGTADARGQLEQIASRFRVELVPLIDLEVTAREHGSPLPDTLRPPNDPSPNAGANGHVAREMTKTPVPPAPDLTIDELDVSRRPSVRRQHIALIVALALVVLIAAAILFGRDRLGGRL